MGGTAARVQAPHGSVRQQRASAVGLVCVGHAKTEERWSLLPAGERKADEWSQELWSESPWCPYLLDDEAGSVGKEELSLGTEMYGRLWKEDLSN